MGFSGPIKTNNETNHVKEQNLVKNPNWQEADQLAVDKWGQGVELWTTENNICPANHSYMYPFSRFLSFLKKKISHIQWQKKGCLWLRKGWRIYSCLFSKETSV